MIKIYSAFCIISLALLICSGCANTLKILDGADAACADIEVDGYFTDSRATGRIIKIPEGTTLNTESIEALCKIN